MASRTAQNKRRAVAGLLSRLASDRSGNTLAIVAASIAPILAMVGSGIDMGRSYLSESRLQQACDAGVLAARKRLGSQVVASGSVPDDVQTTGERFFNVNFRPGSYGTENRNFEMALEENYAITGEATVEVPTTVMRIFGFGDVPLHVRCQAQLNFSNTDVMMVLDTTGSMLQTNPGDSQTKIEALREVVKSFHAQLNGSAPPGTRIRYGFVPYSTNVNVGGLLQSGWVSDTTTFHGRRAVLGLLGLLGWRYEPLVQDVSFLKGVTDNLPLVGGSLSLPMLGTPTSTSMLNATFRGCMEERATYEIDDYDNVDFTRALDLNIDEVPDPAEPDTQWRPMLHEFSYIRSIRTNGTGTFTPGTVDTSDNFINANALGLSACPSPAQKLQPMNATQVATYVDALAARGSTYHDIGMIWGGRLLSPNGLFADENADLPGQPTSRHMIFLTDGETAPLDLSYGTYGIEPLDRRRWSPASPLTLTQVVENRFTVACREVKKRNITMWVISFGVALNPMLTECAGQGRAFEASNADELEAAFSKIATAMGDLRISR